MQNFLRMRPVLVIACFVVASFFLASRARAGSVWLIVGDPQPIAQTGGTFETELKFSSWDAVMGAYSIAVHYDSNILEILEVSTPSESEFNDKTYADEGSFTSGSTEITAFQVDNEGDQDVPATFATIKWKVLGAIGTSGTIEVEAQTIVDSSLRSVDVMSYGITFQVFETDTDGDGLSDDIENATCTDPNDADTDDDCIPDGVEDANHNGFIDANETDPCDRDSDGDGLQDGTELGYTSSDANPDTNPDIFQPDLDPSTTTDPLDDDTDNDGMLDGEEDANHNGRVDLGETDPTKSEKTALPWLPLLLLND